VVRLVKVGDDARYIEMLPFRIFIGWDKREPEAYDVASFSLKRRASIPVEITPIKLEDLVARGLYWRSEDPLASTEFTYSRYLTTRTPLASWLKSSKKL
jgi:hypothetical protein